MEDRSDPQEGREAALAVAKHHFVARSERRLSPRGSEGPIRAAAEAVQEGAIGPHRTRPRGWTLAYMIRAHGDLRVEARRVSRPRRRGAYQSRRVYQGRGGSSDEDRNATTAATGAAGACASATRSRRATEDVPRNSSTRLANERAILRRVRSTQGARSTTRGKISRVRADGTFDVMNDGESLRARPPEARLVRSLDGGGRGSRSPSRGGWARPVARRRQDRGSLSSYWSRRVRTLQLGIALRGIEEMVRSLTWTMTMERKRRASSRSI